MCAVDTRVLGQESLLVQIGVRDRSIAEVHGSPELSSDQDVAAAVDADGPGPVIVRASDEIRPEVRAVGTGQLGDEDVDRTRAGQETTPETDGPRERTRDEDIAARVDGYGHAAVVVQAPERLGPEVRPVGGVLGHEDVPSVRARYGATAEVR